MTPPSFIWISFEDTSPRFGCYGDPVARTPNVDQLAAEGGVYHQAYSTSPVCSPSRASVYTGMYPTFLGAQHMRTILHDHPEMPVFPLPYTCVPPPYVTYFTEHLRAAGYHCSNSGKSDSQFGLDLQECPFTAWDINLPYSDEHPAPWRERPDNTPFFAVFNLPETHESGMWAMGSAVETDPGAVTVPPYLPDTPEVRHTLALQYDAIARNDARVGRIIEELKRDGLYESTVIMIWSDHGEGQPRAKRWPYEAGLRVPLVVRTPETILPNAGYDDRLVSLIDLAPTVLELAGITPPVHLQGQSLFAPRPRQHCFGSRDRFDESYDMIRSVRDSRFRYSRNYYPRLPRLQWIPYSFRHASHQAMISQPEGHGGTTFYEDSRPPEELYDLANDPWEINNLADNPEHQDILHQLREVMHGWQRDYDPYRDITETAMRERFWPGGQQPQTGEPGLFAIGEEADPNKLIADGAVLKHPVALYWYCPTQGASIGYTLEEGDRWLLAGPPLTLDPGSYALRAKAVRTGCRESEDVVLRFTIDGD